VLYKYLMGIFLIMITFESHASGETEQPFFKIDHDKKTPIIGSCSKASESPSVGCGEAPIFVEQGIDLEALKKRFNPLDTAQHSQSPELLIFVSFSMPDESLKQWGSDAQKVGGKLLVRGFLDNSLQKTSDKVRMLFGEKEIGGVMIDPERFQKFKIDKVPAVVLLEKAVLPCDKEPCLEPNYDIVYGDMTLIEALEQIARKGTIEIQKIAKKFLQKCRALHE